MLILVGVPYFQRGKPGCSFKEFVPKKQYSLKKEKHFGTVPPKSGCMISPGVGEHLGVFTLKDKSSMLSLQKRFLLCPKLRYFLANSSMASYRSPPTTAGPLQTESNKTKRYKNSQKLSKSG